jgi:Zn-dependent protease with chaperone function
MLFIVFAFSFLGMFLLLLLSLLFRQAGILCLAVASAFVPMAQMKPNSSRPTAVTIFLLPLPLAASLAYRLYSRCCAFHAIS